MPRTKRRSSPPSTPYLRRATLVEIVDEAATNAPDVRVHLDRPLDAFPEAGTSLTYADLGRLGRRLAAGLYAAGVRRGTRVAIVKRNHLDIYLLAYASMRLGATPALLSSELGPDAARELLEALRAQALVTDRQTATEKALRGLALGELADMVLSIGEGVEGATPIDPDCPDAPASIVRAPDARVLITHTSGTTGVPKLGVQSNRTLAANWATIPAWAKALHLRETVGIHLAFPHIRVVTGATSLLAMRWPLVVVTDPSPGNVDAVFSEHRPGVVETFPNMFILWEKLLSSPTRPLSYARLFFNTFDAMHMRTIQAMLDGSSRRSPIFVQTYGQTETGPITTRLHTRRLARHADGRCVGFAVPGLSRFRVIPDEQTTGTHRGGGEIVARSKALVLDYVGRSDQYAANFCEGWWRMTDIGWRSRWGCLHVQDREIDSTKHAESLLALEDLLMERLRGISEGVLVPLGDGSITPIVCTHDDAPLDLAAWAAATSDFPPLNPPLHCSWEAVPRTGTWKVRRVEARRILERHTMVTLG